MKSKLIEMNPDVIENQAFIYYQNMCNFNRTQISDNKLMEEGVLLKAKVKNQLHIRGIVSYFDRASVKDDQLLINQIAIRCKVLEQITDARIIGAFVYLITIGETNLLSEDLMEQYFFNIWETAYLDASRDYLKEILTDKDSVLSDSLGPGYYGMDIKEMRKIYELVDGQRIDVSLNDNKRLFPMKSNIGIYLKTKEKLHFPGACQSCLGSISGCSFCNKVSN